MRFTRLIAASLLAAYLPACTSYQVIADPSVGLQASPKTVKEARVMFDSGRRFEVMSPRVNGDSLQGYTKDGAPVSVAMTTVQEVEVRKRSGAKTVLLVVGVLVAIPVLTFGIASWASHGFE